jgi:peptidoglycan/xylan/chitin deacetylase (PgdA/CDA1 family)
MTKATLASALHWSGTDRLLAQRASVKRTPLVLGYHRVVEDFRASSATAIAPMLIEQRTFERQLDWVGRRFTFVALDDVAAHIEGTKRFARPLAAVTFDDGYADVYHHAIPILRRKGIPAAVFVVTDFAGSADLMVYDELYLLLARACARWPDPRARLGALLRAHAVPARVIALAEDLVDQPLRVLWTLIDSVPQFELLRIAQTLREHDQVPAAAAAALRTMSWGMLRELAREGFTVGSHSRTHARLTQETAQKVEDETRGSRTVAERELGAPVEHFCYPGGGFNEHVVDAVAAAGYRCAYTSCRHRDARHPALTVPRRLLWERSCTDAHGGFSPSLMSCQVSGVFDFLPAACREDHAA